MGNWGWQLTVDLTLNIDNVERKVTLKRTGDDYTITIEGRSYVASSATICDGVLNFFVGHKTYCAHVSKNVLGTQITLNGRDYFLKAHEDELGTAVGAHHHGDGTVEAPMPGGITAVNVKPGDIVQRGDSVVVLESMKMQNDVTSPVKGKVHRVNCEPGEQVKFGQVLVEITPER